MAKVLHDRLVLARGARTREAALLLAMLEDLTVRLRADLRGVSAAELAWQAAPGHNTIGMLLAHLAIGEVWWSLGVLEGLGRETPFERVLGFGMDGDGLPMGRGGAPPAHLAGKRLAYFERRIALGRAEVVRVARALDPRSLARVRRRRRLDGKVHVYDARWVLHHLVEHFAGHHGQILLIRHQYRARRRTRAR